MKIFSGWNWPLAACTVIVRNVGFLGSIRVLCLIFCPVNGFLRVPNRVKYGILQVFWTILIPQKPSIVCQTIATLCTSEAWNKSFTYSLFRWVYYQLISWYSQGHICPLSCLHCSSHWRAISQLNVVLFCTLNSNKASWQHVWREIILHVDEWLFYDK